MKIIISVKKCLLTVVKFVIIAWFWYQPQLLYEVEDTANF